MKLYWSLLGILTIAVASRSVSQERPFPPDPPNQPPRFERLERFKKMRLIETLKLNEDESVRFFAKQSSHDEKIRDLMKSRNEALDHIQDIVREKGDDKEISKLTDNVLDLDQKVFAERQRYQNELRSFLTSGQFGKFLVFERNFEHHMREAVEDMIQERRRGDRNW